MKWQIYSECLVLICVSVFSGNEDGETGVLWPSSEYLTNQTEELSKPSLLEASPSLTTGVTQGVTGGSVWFPSRRVDVNVCQNQLRPNTHSAPRCCFLFRGDCGVTAEGAQWVLRNNKQPDVGKLNTHFKLLVLSCLPAAVETSSIKKWWLQLWVFSDHVSQLLNLTAVQNFWLPLLAVKLIKLLSTVRCSD